MNAPGLEPLESLQLIAAKIVLGVAHSWDVPPAADQALSDGLYSDSLAELASITESTMTEVAPLLERAMAELERPIPPRTEAAWYLADHCIRHIASGCERPLPLLKLLKDVSYASQDVLPDTSIVGDGLALGSLIGIFWSYLEPEENYYEPEKRLIADEAERQALLDSLASEESQRLVARRASHDQSKNDKPTSH